MFGFKFVFLNIFKIKKIKMYLIKNKKIKKQRFKLQNINEEDINEKECKVYYNFHFKRILPNQDKFCFETEN